MFPARSRSHGGAPRSAVQRSDRRTPLTGGGLPPVADLFAWNPTPLTCIWTWPLPSSMLCSYSICLPSTLPALPFRSSLAPPDARCAAWFSAAAAAPTRRPRRRQPRPSPWPYRLTLLRRRDRPRRRHGRRPTGHWSLAIPLGPPSPPRVSAGRLACRLGRSPPRPGTSPPFKFPPPLTFSFRVHFIFPDLDFENGR